MKLTCCYKFIVLVAGLFLAVQSIARAQISDAGLWLSAGVEARLHKKVTLSIAEELRFNENITELGTAFTDVGLEYKLSKKFKASANFRLAQKRRLDDSYQLQHRFYLDLKYDQKVKPFKLQLRTRFQDNYSDFGSASESQQEGYILRNRLSLQWDTNRKLEPYLKLEFFTPLSIPFPYFTSEIRYVGGVEYSISKKHKLDFYYLINNEINASNPETDYVSGIGYSYQF